MKTLFYSLLACAFTMSTFAAKAIPIPPSDGLGTKITITFELGRKTRNCERLGFATSSLVAVGLINPYQNSENTASGTAWIENDKLKVVFDRASMTEAIYQTHFGSGRFQLEEDYVLPFDVANALGVRSYIIKTGQYSVPQKSNESTVLPVTF